MTQDRLSDRLQAIPVPGSADAREQAVAEARAEVGSRGEVAPGNGGRLRRRVLVTAAAALVLAVALLTPPGRTASAWVGELVGLGDVGGPPTQPQRTFGIAGSAVVLNNGRAPDGSRYEWVAYRCKVDLEDEGSPGKFEGIGISFEWPGVKGHEGSGHCEELEGRPRARPGAIGSHVQILPSQFKDVEEPDLVVSGTTGPAVHSLKVFYREPDGDEHELPVDFERVDGKLRELASRPEALGTYVAFVPGEWAARDEMQSRLDLRALETTGKLQLGPIARRERELAQKALARCKRFEPDPAEFPETDDPKVVARVFAPMRACHERELPPSPLRYVGYDEQGREVGRWSEPLITALVQDPSEIEPAGRERPGAKRQPWRDVPGGGEARVVMKGRAPDGALYEVRVQDHRGVYGACTTLWWPYVEDVMSGGSCGGFPPRGAYGRREPEKVMARPFGFLTQVPQATRHGVLTGFARPGVSRVRVVYRGADGDRHDAPVRLRQIDAERLEGIDGGEATGYWVAFIPRSAGRRPQIEVIAYDENGEVSGRLDYRA